MHSDSYQDSPLHQQSPIAHMQSPLSCEQRFDQLHSAHLLEQQQQQQVALQLQAQAAQQLDNINPIQMQTCKSDTVTVQSITSPILHLAPMIVPEEELVQEKPASPVSYHKENIAPSTSAVTEKTFQPLRPKPSTQPRSTTPKILYEIQSQDGFSFKSTSINELWEKVFESVQVARKAHGLKALPDGPLSEIGGLNMLGLKTNSMRYLVEQLPGAEKCTKYPFKYHKNRLSEVDLHTSTVSEFDDLKEHKHDVARFIPYSTRSEYDMFSWLASRHRKQPTPVVIQNNEDNAIPR